MTDEELLAAVATTEVERMARITALGNSETSGPAEHPAGIIDVVPPPHPCWTAGWWEHAFMRPAHPSRIGGPINAIGIVAHTCDMLEEETPTLIKAWCETVGKFNAAHFLVRRNAAGGVIQFVPINRNANHAGGLEGEHGWLVDASGRRYHPNLATIGIEFENAGGVVRIAGAWRLVEGGKAHGSPIPDDQVAPDPIRPGRGWHKPTDYQLERFAALRADLEAVMAPCPAGLHAVSVIEQPPASAKLPPGRITTHWLLDAKNRQDPWQLITDRLRASADPR